MVVTGKTGDGGGARGGAVLGLLLLWLALYFGVRFYLEAHPELSEGVRIGLALVPMPVFMAFGWSFIRSLRGADELERRIQLEALAVAFPLGLLLLTTLGLMQRAVELNFENWSYNHVWQLFAVFYIAGLMFARRRYA
jgi:hypothetical protein